MMMMMMLLLLLLPPLLLFIIIKLTWCLAAGRGAGGSGGSGGSGSGSGPKLILDGGLVSGSLRAAQSRLVRLQIYGGPARRNWAESIGLVVVRAEPDQARRTNCMK